MSVGSDWDAKSSTESKISNFDCSLVVDQKVLWFEVAMYDSSRVHEYNSLQYLVRITLETTDREEEEEKRDEYV